MKSKRPFPEPSLRLTGLLSPNSSSPKPLQSTYSSMTIITTLHESPERLQYGSSYSPWWSTGNTHRLDQLYTIPHWTCLSSTASYLAVLPRCLQPQTPLLPTCIISHWSLSLQLVVLWYQNCLGPCAPQAVSRCWATSLALVSHQNIHSGYF